MFVYELSGCGFESRCSHANVKVELDLSNYAIKADLKNATGVDTSDFAKKTNLPNLKSNLRPWT